MPNSKGKVRAFVGKFQGEIGGVGAPVTVDDLVVGEVVDVQNNLGNVEITFEVDNEVARRWLGHQVGGFSIEDKVEIIHILTSEIYGVTLCTGVPYRLPPLDAGTSIRLCEECRGKLYNKEE